MYINVSCSLPPITLNNTLDNKPYTRINPHQEVMQVSDNGINQYIEKIKETRKASFDQINTLLADMYKKRYFIGATILCIIIAMFFSYYYYAQRKISHEKNWSSWYDRNSNFFLNESIDNASHHLLEEIQTRYYDKNTPTNAIKPLIDFCIDIEKEIRFIKNFIFVLRISKNIGLQYLLNINYTLNYAEKCQTSILFLKQQFLLWLSYHNITSLEKGNC